MIRSDGTFVRDYFYVQDAVGAYLALAERVPAPEFVGQAFNFGTETPVSVTEIVAMILRLMDRSDLRPRILNQASREITRQYLDCSRARGRLAWQPAYSLDDALAETIAWYRERLTTRPARNGVAAQA